MATEPSVPAERVEPPPLVREIAAVLIASGRPLSIRALANACRRSTEEVAAALKRLKQMAGDFGLKIVEFEGGGVKVLVDGTYRRTIRAINPESIPARGKLSPEAAETLALLQEKGPMTLGEIKAWRGCNARNAIVTLSAWGLVAPAGRAKGRGGPIRYGAVPASPESVPPAPSAELHEQAMNQDAVADAGSPPIRLMPERSRRLRRRSRLLRGDDDSFLPAELRHAKGESRTSIIPFPPSLNRTIRDPDERQFLEWVAQHHAGLIADIVEAGRRHGPGLIAVDICDDPTIVDTTPHFVGMTTLMGIGDWDSQDVAEGVSEMRDTLVVLGVCPYVVFRMVARPGERRCSLTRTTGPVVNRWVWWVTKGRFETLEATDVHRPGLPEAFRREYLEDFRRRFGRDPQPGDPLFYDVDEPVPTPISKEKGRAMLLDLFRAEGEPEDRLYALEKTGYWITDENKDRVSEEMLRAWNAAVQEYHEFMKKRQ